MQKRVVKKYLPLLILLLASIIIVVLWFREAKLFANAEDSMPFYSPSKAANLFSSVWQENGFGFLSSFAIPRSPLMYISAFLNYFLENFVAQAFVFVFLIVSAMIGTYYFSYQLTRKKLASFIAALFYFFNLYAMSQVWQRALYVGMFAWAYLPIYSYLLTKWLVTGQKKILVFLLVSIWIYIRSFGQPSFIFAFIVVTIVVVCLLLLGGRATIKRTTVANRLLVFTFLAVLLNIWWVYPFIILAGGTYTGLTNSLQSFESLRSVSQYFPVSEIILLKQSYFFDSTVNPGLKDIAWGNWYEGWFPILLSWIVLLISVMGWWTHKRGFGWKLLTVLAILGLFISKGTNPPFGYYFYKFLFSNFTFTSALRNSFEKFGIVWLLPYSTFFGLGVYRLYMRVGAKFRITVTFMAGFLACVILVWPMWTGALFPDYDWVSVPQYYREANDLINSDEDEVRVLMLPMIPGHSSRFSWGFRGSDPSIFLFDKVTISKKRETEFYAEKYENINQALAGNGNLRRELEETNIKYLVLRKDLDWKYLNTLSPTIIEEKLSMNSDILKLKDFGGLVVYEVRNIKSGYVVKEQRGSTDFALSYNKNSPTNYDVMVENSQDKFTLVLKQAFNERWVADVDGEKLKNHHIIYGYANAWEVNKKGNYEINILFKVWPWQ